MISRVKPLVGRGVDLLLTRRGYAGTDLSLARTSVLDWLRARRSRAGVVGALGVVVSRPGVAEVQPIEVPLAGPGQVTVEMLVSAVSPGTERAQWLRLPNAQPRLPFWPGYSGVGRVLAVGRGTDGLAVGDVVAVPRARHASVATVPAQWVARVPEGVPLEQAALVYLAIISGYGVRRAGLPADGPVCVIGAGTIGALAARLSLLEDAGPLTVVARTRRHESTGRVGGADFRTVDDGVGDLAAAVVIEATGDPAAIGTALAAARPGGTVVLLGSPRGRSELSLATVQERSLRLVGAHVSALAKEVKRSGTDVFGEIAGRFLAALADGRLDVADLVGEAVDPREIGRFYRALARGEVTAGYLDWRRLNPEERRTSRRVTDLPVMPRREGRIPAVPPSPVAASSRPLRFAVVGCGDIGTRNARAVARAGNAELVLLQDPVHGLAEAAAAQHGGRAVRTLEEAFDPAVVDAVLLSVPHDLHAPLALQAMSAGLHVVVEKPLAVDLASAREMVDAADRAGVLLSPCFPYRYEPAPVAAREMVAAGALGEFRGAALVFHADKPPSYWLGGFSGRATSDWRGSRARAGGGVLIMNMTHHVDLLRHLTGCEVTEVSAVTRHDADAEVEDAVAVTLRFTGGGVGTLLGSASTRGAPPSRFDLWGDAGSVQLEPEARLFTERAVPGALTRRWNSLPREPEVDERTVFVERFAAAALTGGEPDVTAADGLAVQAVVEAAYESARIGGIPVPVAFPAVREPA